MKKKIIIRVAVGLTSVFAIFFVGLMVHLYSIVKNTDENPNSNIQLSRIDFKQPVDSAEALRIKNYVLTLNGVKGAYFNIPHGTLVYGYKLGTQNSEAVYNKTMDFIKHKYIAVRYVVTAEQLKHGCPANTKNSLLMQFANFLYKIFN